MVYNTRRTKTGEAGIVCEWNNIAYINTKISMCE